MVRGLPTVAGRGEPQAPTSGFSSGPNGIRPRVPTSPHAFASESRTCGVLSQRLRRGDGNPADHWLRGAQCPDGNRFGSARIQCPGAVLTSLSEDIGLRYSRANSSEILARGHPARPRAEDGFLMASASSVEELMRESRISGNWPAFEARAAS